MSTYWLMLLVPLLAGLSPWKAKGALPLLQWFLYGFLLIFILGLRHEVGGDWLNYIQNFEGLVGVQFSEVFSIKSISRDFGFEVIHWFCLNYLNGVYATNLICAGFFTAGLLRICRRMPVPWLALTIAIPYLVIVVAMGYTRQAVAIGFIMWGLVDLMDGKQVRFYIALLFGALFHKTAIAMLPVGYLYGNSIRNIKDLMVFLVMFAVAFMAFMFDRLQFMVYNYVTNSEMESSGAFIRVLMNVAASLVFLYYRKKWAEKYPDYSLWLIFSISSLLMLPLTFVNSTTIDRIALYFIPIQLVVFSRVPVLITDTYHRTMFLLVVLIGYIAAMFVWLNYGANAGEWLPYQNLLFI